MKNSTTTNKFPLPKDKIWTRLPDRVQVLEDSKVSPTYKVYTALVTQSGTNAPVATVLENTLVGTVSFYYDGAGSYVVVNSIPWDQTKTTFQLEVKFGGFGSFQPSYVPVTGGGKTFNAYNNIGTAGSQPPYILEPADGILNKSFFEIRVYS